MTMFGYAREGQSLSAQVAELKAAGAQRVFQEKINGTRSDRKQLKRLLVELDNGAVVLVTRLDRLARSTRDLLNVLAVIGEAKASFRSLHDARADTTTTNGRLILTVLGGLAEFERHLIVASTSEGRKRAKARGVLFGRPPKLTRTSVARRSRGGSAATRRWWRSLGATMFRTRRSAVCDLCAGF
jgi:DNA invertase Pin-like site-specific DNA recombinase